jgi:hypothetical protein
MNEGDDQRPSPIFGGSTVKFIFNVLLCSSFISSSERDDCTERLQDGRGREIKRQIKLQGEMVEAAAPICFPIRETGRTNRSTQLRRSDWSGSGKLCFSAPR